MDDIFSNIDGIVQYREQLSVRISFLLERFGSAATVEDVKTMILEHDEARHPSECFADLFMLFDTGEDDLDHLLLVIQEAWNYFPHRSLGGSCPAIGMANLVQPRARRRKSLRPAVPIKPEGGYPTLEEIAELTDSIREDEITTAVATSDDYNPEHNG